MGAFRFFTSYAHADAQADNLLRDFYKALSDTLKRTIAATEEGFFDEASIPVGGQWPRSLEGALHTAKCMLSFYSPSYFNSKYSGKEVKAFQLRMEQYRQQNPASDPALLLGVLWENKMVVESIIPPSLRDVQYGVPHFGDLNRTHALQEMVNQHGLRSIMQRKDAGSNDDRVAFVDIVERYAAQIRQATTNFDLSACDFPGNINDLSNDFPLDRAPEQAAAPTAGSYGKGPKFVRVLFLVGKANTFATVEERKKLDYYDDSDERLWRPFLPSSDDPIANLVAGVVASEKLVADWVRLPAAPDETTFQRIVAQAMADKNVLVVLIDPWSVFVPDLQASLNVLDKTRLVYGAMFLPWNDEDEETKRYSDTLQEKLKRTFEALSADNEAVLSQIVFHSSADLANQLRTRIAVIRSRIVSSLAKQGQIRPLPSGTSLPSAPVSVR
jgi:FxsC-like protein